MQDPKSAALIFESGRVVITILHRPEDTPAAVINLLNNLKEAGIACRDKPEVAIINIVCSSDPGYPLNLARIMVALMNHERVGYEPEVIPGLVCRISDTKIVSLLFSSGTIVTKGGKNREDVKSGQIILREKLSGVT